jgi:trehalose 6-phosphate synthase
VNDKDSIESEAYCDRLQSEFFADRSLVILANRGPISFLRDEDGGVTQQRGGGGLVTALTGLCRHTKATWISCAQTEADRAWKRGALSLDGDLSIDMWFLTPEAAAYDGYYNVISNPLLWFLQHSMWDVPRAPIINRDTWEAWNHGYAAVNRLFADAVVSLACESQPPPLVMLQDYHLYLAPMYIRHALPRRQRPTLLHFVHIPWPGPEYWRILPPGMRQTLLEGLCSVDVLGFQTRQDGLNFIRTCESMLPRASVNYRRGRIWYRNHATYVRNFPISIDVDALHRLAASDEVREHRDEIEAWVGDRQLILRIDRIEPSKNIVRGFLAYEEMLELHPEHRGKVQFLAILVPSRLRVEEYQSYLDELMAAAGRINATYGDSEWEPVRLLVGEDYGRAVAAMQLYDVLLVNPIADGMNLVAKEGPLVNERSGVLILSERAGAHEQLQVGAISVSPCDVYATAEAMHQALVMPLQEREAKLNLLRWTVEGDDIQMWMCKQLEAVTGLNL